MNFRQYDPAIARWTGIDPVTHNSMSTYTAFDNNPVYWADPSGANSVNSIQEAWDATPEDGSSTWNSDGNGGFCDDCNTDPKKKKKKSQKKDVKDMSAGEFYGMAYNGASRTAFLNGNDPYNPTEADIAQNEREKADAAGELVMFVVGEWAAVKVLQGGAWIIRFVRARNIAQGVNVARGAVKFSEKAKRAIYELGSFHFDTYIKNGVGRVDISFTKSIPDGALDLVESTLRANGAESIKVITNTVTPRFRKIFNYLSKRGGKFEGYTIRKRSNPLHPYELTKTLK